MDSLPLAPKERTHSFAESSLRRFARKILQMSAFFLLGGGGGIHVDLVKNMIFRHIYVGAKPNTRIGAPQLYLLSQMRSQNLENPMEYAQSHASNRDVRAKTWSLFRGLTKRTTTSIKSVACILSRRSPQRTWRIGGSRWLVPEIRSPPCHEPHIDGRNIRICGPRSFAF